MSLWEEMIAPSQDILVTNTAVMADDAMGLVIVNRIVEGEAVVLLIATIVARGDAVKGRTVSTPMITDDALGTLVEDEVERMKKI